MAELPSDEQFIRENIEFIEGFLGDVEQLVKRLEGHHNFPRLGSYYVSTLRIRDELQTTLAANRRRLAEILKVKEE